ncbi:MAG: response regulator [Hyphomonadaceae bacterium]
MPDLSALTALVVDENHFQRGITTDILRTSGVGRVLQTATGAEGWEMILAQRPDCIFTDWLSGDTDALALTRLVRLGQDSPNRAMPIFMVTAQGARADVENARAAGMDAFLRKPLSVQAVAVRLVSVVAKPRRFIETTGYVGPCRRRRDDPSYTGPRRRLSDKADAAPEAPDDEEVRREIAKARIAVVESLAQMLKPGDVNAARRVFAAARELHAAAVDSADTPLTQAANDLLRYLETLGATSGFDFEALRTHISALHQLVHLPNAMAAERAAVAQSLTKMVDKKLRQTNAA